MFLQQRENQHNLLKNHNQKLYLQDFDSFREAYNSINEVKKPYFSRGVFDECDSCDKLKTTCSGGPAIAKKLGENLQDKKIIQINKGD